MLKSLRRVSVLALAGFLVWGCGRERLTTSQVPEGGVGVRRARVEIAGSGVSGYYSVRATQEGISLGSWTSIPINAGYESTVELPVGAKARVTGSLRFVSERSPKRPNSFRFLFADYRQNGGTGHV